MTTPIEKPVRRSKGRVPPPKVPTPAPAARPPAPAQAADPPPAWRLRPPPAQEPAPAQKSAPASRPKTPAMRKRQSGSRKRGDPAVSEDEMTQALHAYRKRATRHPQVPAESPEARRQRNYPWYTRAASNANIYPDKRLLDPIQKPLERIGQRLGVRRWQFFSDWLEIVELSLKHMPGHLAYAKATGKTQPFPPGTPQDEIDRWMKVFTRYGSKEDQAFVYQQFHEAFHALLDAAADGIYDYVGNVYQDMELTDKTYSGQFWTPMTVAVLMAEMMQPAHGVYENIYQALTHPDNIEGQALLLSSVLFQLIPRPGQEAEDASVVAELNKGAGDFFFERLLPAAMPYYTPVTIQEPCVGSGVMLLAIAACVPAWMNQLGLIQYYGQDSDIMCVRMASINLMIFGLNGFGYRCWEAAQEPDTLEILNDPARQAEWTAIRAKLDAEREAQRVDQAAILAQRTAAGVDGMHLEVEDVTGADGRSKKKRSLKDDHGNTQLEMF
ncbi:N-6 DNA methylase [Chloroflexales bacterium ZM16-3]|nr:N-6 DNA methylase [Chloroflexales bacterium ZM16-3]